MTERPILFSGPMVRGIFDGRKTMTRRVVKLPASFRPDPAHRGDDRANILATVKWYAQPGDRLWVRETFSYVHGDGVAYRATNPELDGAPWKPSIFMPRKLSRLTLEVVNVRVERLQEITPADAIAEGIPPAANSVTIDCDTPNPVHDFRSLWDSINAKPRPVMGDDRKISHYVSYPWEDVQEIRTHRGKPWRVIGNPWVWPIEFKRLTEPTDTETEVTLIQCSPDGCKHVWDGPEVPIECGASVTCSKCGMAAIDYAVWTAE